MQQSAYSEYSTWWQGRLQSVNTKCSLSLPTELQAPLYNPPAEETPACYTGTTYTTQKGDSCASIALANKVSAHALYTGNQDLLQSCQNLDAGLELCIPVTCSVYQVQADDTCTGIEQAENLDFGTLARYNTWLWSDCSNLESGVQNYGDVVCISPQGGLWNETSPVGTPVGNGDLSSFWSYNVTAPPNGSTIANGTTHNCGVWYVAMNADSKYSYH